MPNVFDAREMRIDFEQSQKSRIQNVDITCTDNGGYTVRVTKRSAPSKSGKSSSPEVSYQEPSTYAFSGLDELQGFLTKIFGDTGDKTKDE